MRRKLRRRLEAKRDAVIQKAAEDVLAGRREDIGDHLQEINAYDKLISATPRDRLRQGLIAAAVGLICISVIAMASTLRVPETKFILAVKSEVAALRLAETWSWSDDLPLRPDLLRLEEFVTLDVPAPRAVGKRLEGSPWAQIDGGEATMNELVLGKDGLLTVESNDDGMVRIYLQGAAVRGELTIQGNAEVLAGTTSRQTDVRYRLESSFPETVRFRAVGQSIVPARLQIRPKQDFVLRDVPVKSLSFSRDTPDRPGAIVFVSTIKGGTLILSDVAETVELLKGERLSLKGLKGRITEMRVNDQIDLRFEGWAEEVRIGSEGFDRNLAPSLLDYLYQNQRLPFFWSAFVFLWGILWSTRKLLFP